MKIKAKKNVLDGYGQVIMAEGEVAEVVEIKAGMYYIDNPERTVMTNDKNVFVIEK